MESLDYWRLCDSFNIIEATALIIGEDPSHMECWNNEYPKGYEAVIAALKSSLKSGKIIPELDCHLNINWTNIDLSNVYIQSDEIKRWLESRGFTTGFFFPEKQHNLPYLDKSNPCYAPKLAVAVMAWEEVTNNIYLLKNKSPKKALEAWLEANATKFELSSQAIEEIAKIANWNTKGGAPSTPSILLDIKEEELVELDDEIPF